MVVRIEAVVGELDRDEHRLPAMVLEPGVVGTVVDRMVVRVDDVEIEVVALGRTRQSDNQFVRTVAVLAVMDVDAIARLAAIADHVHLEHADDIGLRRSALVAVLVTAPEPLLFAGKMHEAHGVAELEVLEGTSYFEDAGGAGGIVIRTRCDLFVLPRIADRRVEVTADDHDLLGVDGAADFSFDVVVGLAAHLVGDALDWDAERLVVVFDIRQRQLDAFGIVTVAGANGHGLAANHRRHFTAQDVEVMGDAGDGDGSIGGDDARIGSRQVADVDGGSAAEARATNFLGVELAAAARILAGVNRMEFAVVCSFVVAIFTVLVTVIVTVVVVVLSVAGLANRVDDKAKDNEKRDDCAPANNAHVSLLYGLTQLTRHASGSEF